MWPERKGSATAAPAVTGGATGGAIPMAAADDARTVITRLRGWWHRAYAPTRARLVTAAYRPWTTAPVSVYRRHNAGQQAAREEAHMIKRTRIVRIGNSQGIRIPKKLLAQSGLGPEVELEVWDQQIIICAARPPREGWEESFLRAQVEATPEDEQEEAALLRDMEAMGPTEFDRFEWEWPDDTP
jgi:antitoxin MazE